MPPRISSFEIRFSAQLHSPLASCATLTKPESDVSFENLRAIEISFVDQYAVPGKRFDAAAFDAKVAEGNAKFQDAMTNEKFKARRPVLKDLADQFKAEAAHLRKKASIGKITKALAAEMKRDINDNYDHAVAKKTEQACKTSTEEAEKIVRTRFGARPGQRQYRRGRKERAAEFIGGRER